MKLRQYLCVAISVLSVNSVYAQRPVTINCESGNRSTDAALCWSFPGTTYSSAAAITGGFSARTGQLTGTPNGATSPWILFDATGVITWKMKLDGWAATTRNFVLIRENAASIGTYDTLYQYTFTSGNATTVVNPSVNINFSGVARIYFSFYGTGGTTRGILDDVSIDGAYNASPSLGCIPTPTVTDTDGDGVADGADAFPNDAARAYAVRFPSSGSGTVMFEDTWPNAGDYDLNDLVVDVDRNATLSATNQVVDITYNVTVRACGGSYHNGLLVQYDGIAPSKIDSVTGSVASVGSYVDRAANGTENGQAFANILFFDDAYDVLPTPASGDFINTIMANPYVGSVTKVIKVNFNRSPANRVVLDSLKQNIYMVVSKVRGNEVHLVDNIPTSKANTALFNTGNDSTNVAAGRYYRTRTGLPFGISVESASIPYMKESVDFVQGYPRIADWAVSGGTTNNDWFISANRVTSSLYIR